MKVLEAPALKSWAKEHVTRSYHEYKEYKIRWKDASITRRPASMKACLTDIQLKRFWKFKMDDPPSTLDEVDAPVVEAYIKSAAEKVLDYDSEQLAENLKGYWMDESIPHPETRVEMMLEAFYERYRTFHTAN